MLSDKLLLHNENFMATCAEAICFNCHVSVTSTKNLVLLYNEGLFPLGLTVKNFKALLHFLTLATLPVPHFKLDIFRNFAINILIFGTSYSRNKIGLQYIEVQGRLLASRSIVRRE